MVSFSDLLTEHIGFAYVKQLAFADFVGDRAWKLDLPAAQVSFGSDLVYPIQLLGSEAEGDKTWLWSWANEGSDLPPSVTEFSMDMRDFGVSHGIVELSEGQLDLSGVNGHTLSLVAAGIFPECVYFRGPIEGGALYFLLLNPPESVLAPATAERVITVIREVISEFPVVHLPMSDCLFRSQGFSVAYTEDRLEAVRDGNTIVLEYNDRRHITSIDGAITATPGA